MERLTMLRSSLFAGAALVLLSCATGPSFTNPPAIAANPNPAAPQAAVLSFTGSAPVKTTIHVSDGVHQWDLHYDETHDPAAGLAVIGMRPEREHQITVTITDASGSTAAPEPLTFTTPPLPADPTRFPPIEVTINQSAELEPGFVLFNPRRRRIGQARFGAGFGMLLAVDYTGDVLWYYQSDSRISDFEKFANGNLFYVTQDYRIVETDWLGNTQNTWYAKGRPDGPYEGGIPVDTLTFHHEVDQLPSGNIIVLGSEIREVDNYYTSEYDKNAPRRRQPVMGDVIVEFNPATGETVWEWKAFDNMDPFRIGYEAFSGYWDRRGFPGAVDWSHANNLIYDASDDSIIVNFRYQAAAVKIDRATKEIKWILGEPGGWDDLSGKLLKPIGDLRWPYHQHSPSPTPEGTVLIFDNGNYQARPFTPPLPPNQTHTRAVEYKIDEANRTIQQIWESEGPGPDAVVSFAMGDVDYMPQTRNALVAYGFVMAPEAIRDGSFQWRGALNFHSGTRLRQFRRSTPAAILWEMVLYDDSDDDPVGWSLFGAEHYPSWTND
jgi:arylsulfate sulfotransferase